MEQEIWKPVVGWEEYYEVSNLGRVKSLPRWRKTKSGYLSKEKILAPRVCGKQREYLSVALCDKYHSKQEKIHRLVAMAFIPNPNNYKEINHKDENKANNRVENLEWCSRLYNVTYNGIAKRRMAWRKKRCGAYDNDNNLIQEFDSLDEAAKWVKRDSSAITHAIQRKGTCGGYYWKIIKQ